MVLYFTKEWGLRRTSLNIHINQLSLKRSMISIQKEIRSGKWKSRMLLQVHDELVFDVPKLELEAFKIVVKEKMENAFKIDVPLVVDVGVDIVRK